MPKEQRERLEELAEVVKDMELGRAEDERDRRREEAQRKRDVAGMRRRLQREVRKHSREVRARETQANELRKSITGLERDEERLIGRKLRRDEKFEENFSKVKRKESEKNMQRLSKGTETIVAREKLASLDVALRDLEQNQIPALNDAAADRGGRTRSSSRASVLELEVDDLRKESVRLDEEHAKLLQELDKARKSVGARRDVSPDKKIKEDAAPVGRSEARLAAASDAAAAVRAPSAPVQAVPAVPAPRAASAQPAPPTPPAEPAQVAPQAAAAQAPQAAQAYAPPMLATMPNLVAVTPSAGSPSRVAAVSSRQALPVATFPSTSRGRSSSPTNALVQAAAAAAAMAPPAFAWGSPRSAEGLAPRAATGSPVRPSLISTAPLLQATPFRDPFQDPLPDPFPRVGIELVATAAASAGTPLRSQIQTWQPTAPWAWSTSSAETASRAFTAGTRVEAMYNDGRWYPAVIDSAERPDGSFNITWEDGATWERTKMKHELRRPATTGQAPPANATAIATAPAALVAGPGSSAVASAAAVTASGGSALARLVTPSASFRSPSGSPGAASAFLGGAGYQPIASPTVVARRAPTSSPPPPRHPSTASFVAPAPASAASLRAPSQRTAAQLATSSMASISATEVARPVRPAPVAAVSVATQAPSFSPSTASFVPGTSSDTPIRAHERSSPSVGPRASPTRLASPLPVPARAAAPAATAPRPTTERSRGGAQGFAAAVHKMTAQALHEYRLAHVTDA